MSRCPQFPHRNIGNSVEDGGPFLVRTALYNMKIKFQPDDMILSTVKPIQRGIAQCLQCTSTPVGIFATACAVLAAFTFCAWGFQCF